MKINKETIQFLSKLSDNNNKEWFQKNKEEYNLARQNILDFIQSLFEILSTEDTRFHNAKAHKSMFRLYRDMRFVAEGTKPYKEHFGIVLSPLGTKTQEPTTYIQIKPGGGFIGVGMWQAQKENLAAIRQEIDYSDDEFSKIVAAAEKKNWKLSYEDSLKTAPRNYEKDNKNINYIKLKSFVLSQAFEEEMMYESDFDKIVLSLRDELKDFTHFLHRSLS